MSSKRHSYDIVRVPYFYYNLIRGDDMKIEEFIKSYPEFEDLPFAVVYKVFWHLKINGYLKENV